MSHINELDVRKIEPHQKHPAIFQKFESLATGESFILVNDHDPRPLYYQFSGERPGEFSWTYLEQGPEVWKVKIGKTEKTDREETLGEIVAKDYRKAEVFKKYGLDFCCGGKKTVSQACQEAGVDAEAVRSELKNYDGMPGDTTINRFDRWEPDFLVDYIVNNHHSYVKQSLADMPQYVNKVGEAHGEAHPETRAIAGLFNQLGQELIAHMQKEENVLFPFIKNLVAAQRGENIHLNFPPRHIQQPIRMMEMEHDAAGNILKEIRQLSSDYALPDDACAAYEMVYKFLQEFEADLYQHIHLENNILFPRALELSEEITVS